MGTFAQIFIDKGAVVPEHKMQEFMERIEMIFQAGGMMQVNYKKLNNKEIPTIQIAKMNEKGMNFYYNYFEDDIWENAGFDKTDGSVWSNKIGQSHFHKAVIAAYILQELYTDGITATIVDGKLVTSWGYVGWINYLFKEKFHVKNFDAWKLFETVHYLGEVIGYPKETDDAWLGFGAERYAFIAGCEIDAVLHGTDEAMRRFGALAKKETEVCIITSMKTTRSILQNYQKECEEDKNEQLRTLIHTMYTYYESMNENRKKGVLSEGISRELVSIITVSDAPAFTIKVIAEIYNRDFWELWSQIKEVAKRTGRYSNAGYHVVPISTEKFFRQSADDRIPYWKEVERSCFSKELERWFEELKQQFEMIIQSGYVIKKPIEYMSSLMEYADATYYHIYAFTDFLEECLENLNDKRYLALWKIYEQMLYNPELKKAGDILFAPDEWTDSISVNEVPKRRLKKYWDSIDKRERNNKARVTFRRYMALVANKELRYKVFGF